MPALAGKVEMVSLSVIPLTGQWPLYQERAFGTRCHLRHTRSLCSEDTCGPVHTDGRALPAQLRLGAFLPCGRPPCVLRYPLAQRLDAVQRRWSPQSRSAATLVLKGRCDCSRSTLFSRQTHAKARIHPTDMKNVLIFQALEQVGIITMGRMRHIKAERHTPFPRCAQSVEGGLELGSVGQILGHAYLATPVHVIGPTRQQIQPVSHQPTQRRSGVKRVSHIVGCHDHLAAADPAQRLRVLWLRPYRTTSLLGPAELSRGRMRPRGLEADDRCTRSQFSASESQSESTGDWCSRCTLVPL